MPIIGTGDKVLAPLRVVISAWLARLVYRFGVRISNWLDGPHARWDDELTYEVHGDPARGGKCPRPTVIWHEGIMDARPKELTYGHLLMWPPGHPYNVRDLLLESAEQSAHQKGELN
jgi:hypothetical protein